MTKNKIFIIGFSLSVLLFGGFIISSNKEAKTVGEYKGNLKVYYSSDCSCCLEYAKIMRDKGFNVEERVDEMDARMDILESAGIPMNMSSCHVSVAEGYYFEGHIPAMVIEKVLSEKPEIDGIVLPGMPMGAPGMGGFKNTAWIIYQGINGEFEEFIVL